MPKETLHNSQLNYSRNTPNDKDMNVTVGWGKGEGNVQIATVNFEGGLSEKEFYESKDGSTGGYHLIPLDVVTPGWFVDLDRDGINLLIRTLRKARDDAFGRDE